MRLLELLGRRWALRILWELREAPQRFRELQTAIGASPSIINTRLAELRDAGLIELERDSGYLLTALGTDFMRRFLPLCSWAETWAAAGPR